MRMNDASMLNYTIMVVEDDLSLAELLNHELQDSGFHVSYHNSGKKALEQMKIEATRCNCSGHYACR